MKVQRTSGIEPGSIVVVTLTGNGLKDPDCALEHAEASTTAVEPELDAVKVAMGL